MVSISTASFTVTCDHYQSEG